MSLVSITITITLSNRADAQRLIVYLSILNDRQIDRALLFYPALGNPDSASKNHIPPLCMVDDDVI